MAGYATFWYGLSILFKRSDIADIAWGLGYILLCGYLFLNEPSGIVSQVCYLLVTIWGLRLSIFIFSRNIKKQEDFRYKAWRESWGATFLWRSFLQVFLLQALLIPIVLLPVILSSQDPDQSFSIISFLGILVWLIGFYFQAVGDYQLAQFKKDTSNKGKIIQHGLWKYTRHPNYFGEIMMWWGVFMITLPLDNSLYGIIGPVTITLLIRYVSGVPMLEHKYEGNKKYQQYKARTNMLIPWFPKN